MQSLAFIDAILQAEDDASGLIERRHHCRRALGIARLEAAENQRRALDVADLGARSDGERAPRKPVVSISIHC